MQGKKEKNNLKEVLTVLEKGGVVALGTDTVYGFVCLAENRKAVLKIYKIKGRKKEKALPIFVSTLAMAKKYAFIKKEHEKILDKYWPGRLTAILPKNKNLLEELTGKNPGIGIRIPDDEFLLKIIRKLKKPLAQTSANLSGQKPLEKADDIEKKFKNSKTKPDLIVDAGRIKRKSSTIVDFMAGKPRIIRKGVIKFQ